MAARKKLNKGEVLFKEGDEAEFAYFVASGQLELVTQKNGTEIVLSQVLPGELIGEMSVIDRTSRFSTAVAIETCVLFKVHRDQLLGRITDCDPIVQSLLTGFSRRYKGSLKLISGELETDTVKNADTALNQAISSEKITLEHQLKEAIRKKELDVRFLAIIEVATDEIVGYEALIHWDHPERGIISPLEFIALAEETLLIDDVSLFVVEYSCMAINELKLRNKNVDPFISINISPKQITRENFVINLVNKINASDLPKGSIKLEITENANLEHEKIFYFIELCHKNEIKVTLDNFGTGSSNLSLMQKFHFDTINIDKSFTNVMQKNPRSRAIVNTIVSLANTLKADVMVGGIETEEMLDYARELNCRYAQGYHIGMPMLLENLNVRTSIKMILSEHYLRAKMSIPTEVIIESETIEN